MREKFRDIVTKTDRFEWVNEAKVGTFLWVAGRQVCVQLSPILSAATAALCSARCASSGRRFSLRIPHNWLLVACDRPCAVL